MDRTRVQPYLEKDKPVGPTCEQIFQMQFVPRRNAIIQALTAELGRLLEKCDPSLEPLCLYGYPDRTWDVTIEEDVPCEVPEPCLGINWQMSLNIYDWINSVAMRSDAWLLRIISVLIGTYHLDHGQRGILFDKICSLDTILEEITRYYTRNDVPGIVGSIYYRQSLISIPGNTTKRNNGEQKQRRMDQRNTGEQQHRNTGEQQHRNIAEQQHRNTGEQQHRNIAEHQHRNTGEQQHRNIAEQQHRNIAEQQHRNTKEQEHKNTGDQPHKRSNLINASRSNGDQPHKRSKLINASRSNGDQPHKRSNLMCLSGNNGDQSHERSNLICFSGNNGDQPHKRKRSSHIFYTRNEHGQKRSGDQSHERSNLICFSGNNGDQPHKRKRSSHIFYTRNEHGQKRSEKQKEENQFVQSKTSEDHCGRCNELAKGDEFWIWCDVCERWFHGDCVGVNEEDAKSIGKFECPLCKQGPKKRHRAKETKT